MLLDIDYITQNRIPVVRLFGKLPDGRSIIALDRNFSPYIYVQTQEVQECLIELNQIGLSKVERLPKIDGGELKEFLKVVLKHPREIFKLKNEIEHLKSVEALREHDIPFFRRYLIDKGLFPMGEVEVQGKLLKHSRNNSACIIELQKEPQHVKSSSPELNILSFKIEICHSPSMSRESEDPIIMISFSSNQGFQKVFSTKESSLDFVETVSSEKELILKFVGTIKSENPDIILGYNSDKFDFPYLKERARKLGLPLKLGVDGSKLKFITVPKKAASIKGRIHVDLYRVVRRHLQLNSHTLQSVYRELLGDDKIDIPLDQIQACWNSGSGLDRLFKYSLEDAVAVTEIGGKMLPLSLELTRLVGQPLFEIVRRGTGTQVEWYLIRKAVEYGYVVPNKFGTYLRDVVGGHVEDPTPGLHENIFYFDFRSLYPSIIIAKNISPDTLTEDGDEETCHVAPEFGYKFRKEPIGFIPQVTAQILDKRIRTKTRMNETTDPEERQILDFRQNALKTLISTIYGLFNHSTYRWYSIEASEAITAWGREFLKKTMEDAQKEGFKVLYADTDGFYAVFDDE